MDRPRLSNKQMTEEERQNAIKTYCRQKLPLKKTAARINARKKAEEEAQVSPLRTLHRCRSPPQPLRDTRARQSTCPTCVAFAEREALRTNTGRAQKVSGRGLKAAGSGGSRASKVSVHAQPGVLSHISGAHEVPPGAVDPCVVRQRQEQALRDPERMPARGPLRWERRKCLEPQILNKTISDVPWGGTPGARLLPAHAPRVIPSHPLEKSPKSSPEYWRQQFEILEDQVRGPHQAVKQMWDALTPSILLRIAPILDIPMPTVKPTHDDFSYAHSDYASSEWPMSEEKSDPAPFWETLSLPEDIPEMNITESESAFKDWQYASPPTTRAGETLPFGMFRNERTSLQLAVLTPDRFSKSDHVHDVPSKNKAMKKKLPPTRQDRRLGSPKREAMGKKDKRDKGQKADLVIAVKKSLAEKRGVVRHLEDAEVAEEKEIRVQEPIDSRRYIKVHEHYEEIGKDTQDDYRVDLTWAAPKDKEHEGEFLSPEYQQKTDRGSRGDTWTLESFFTSSYIEERRRLVGSEQLNREMMEFINLLNIDLEVHPPTLYPRDEGLFSIPGRPNNPYYNFLQKPKRKAAIWREHFKPETTGEAMDAGVLLHPELNLPEKAHHISSKITSEFVDWVKSLGGVRPTELNEELIQQLFDVTFDMPAAKSLCVRVRELPVVTKQVADACFAPDGEEQEGLRLELQRDLEAEKRNRHLVAFDKYLERCCPQRFVAPHNKVRRTWIECHVPEDLTSSRFVFEGITHLVSVQRFCEWLDRHPNQEPPSYLRDIGMVGPEADRFRARGGQGSRLRSRSEEPTRPSRPTNIFRSFYPRGPSRADMSFRETAPEPKTSHMSARESQAAKKLDALHKSLCKARQDAIL